MPLRAKCTAEKSYFAGSRYRRCRCACVCRSPSGFIFSAVVVTTTPPPFVAVVDGVVLQVFVPLAESTRDSHLRLDMAGQFANSSASHTIGNRNRT